MKKLLCIVIMMILSGCADEAPVQVPDTQPEIVRVQEMSVMDLFVEAKQLGITGREADAALDNGKQGLYDLIQERKKQ